MGGGESDWLNELACMFNNTSMRNILKTVTLLLHIYGKFHWLTEMEVIFHSFCFCCRTNSTRRKWQMRYKNIRCNEEGQPENDTWAESYHMNITITMGIIATQRARDLPMLTDWVSRGDWSPDSQKTILPVNNSEGSRWG